MMEAFIKYGFHKSVEAAGAESELEEGALVVRSEGEVAFDWKMGGFFGVYSYVPNNADDELLGKVVLIVNLPEIFSCCGPGP
jgi:hypothetical protein